jgi:signal transduction histidine kinase
MVVDVALAAVVAFPTAMDTWWNEEGSRQADAVTYALTAVSILALLGRRRWPYATTLVCGLALTGWYVRGHHGELLNLPTMVGLYTVAVQGDRRSTIVTGVVASSWSGILGFTSDDPIGARGGSPVMEMLVPLVPLALGEAGRIRRELVERAEAEREQEARRRVAAEREQEARRRVAAERVHMAQEFHDLVAHTMAAVNVHMGVAVAAFDADPAAARRALLQARSSSKEALQELRAAVAVLRDPPGPGPGPGTRPTPRLADVGELADIARAAGIAVTVEADVAGADPGGVELSAAVELAAYRIVQEALTNVVRHSDARHLAVSLRRQDGRLVVEVLDDGTATPGPPAPAGTSPDGRYGLRGMGERAAAVGGRVEHGPAPGGGFRVVASLPATAVDGPGSRRADEIDGTGGDDRSDEADEADGADGTGGDDRVSEADETGDADVRAEPA